MNILFCSAGRRCELLKDFRRSMGSNGKIVSTDISNLAPALYIADSFYLVPRIDSPDYIPTILQICKEARIDVITTCIDPEIMILANHREAFSEIGVEVLTPFEETAKICFDKFETYRFLKEEGIRTVETFGTLSEFAVALSNGNIDFPVFVKPRTGSGSVGARKIENMHDLSNALSKDPSLIIQEYMGDAIDIDVDAYIDTVSHETVSLFSKRKLEMKIGGASKTISFKDDKLTKFVCDAISHFRFNGPIDMDLWYRNGEYYLSEVNPRFGGAYLHAYGSGVDFVKLIENNVQGIANKPVFNNYENDVVMMMYDSVVIQKL